MANSQDLSSARGSPGISKDRDDGEHHGGIQKETSPQCRRSQRILNLQKRKETTQEQDSAPVNKSHHPSVPSKGQKRPWKAEHPVNLTSTDWPVKRLRNSALEPRPSQPIDRTALGQLSATRVSHISSWAQEGQVWPKEFFEEDKMQRLHAKTLPPSLRRKRSEGSILSSTTPTELRQEKVLPYKNVTYEAVLEREAGSYLVPHRLGITEASKRICQDLLSSKQSLPVDTFFDDEVFAENCRELHGKNEARIFKDLTPMIVPWAEAHMSSWANRGRRSKTMIESVNEGWNNSYPITQPRPQPDYAVGFRRSAFSEDQLEKLRPCLGDPTSASYFMATYYMHFPFLTCEVKGSIAGLDVADRQNLHSMTLAVRGIVELFRAVNRAEELHREILAFSISHTNETIAIFGHYPVIEGDKTTYWRHEIAKYILTSQDGRDKWTAYTFVKNIYDSWAPKHLQRISSAIDCLPAEQHPEIPFHVSEPPMQGTSGVPLQVGNHYLAEIADRESGRVNVQQMTPDTSNAAEKPASKKKKGKV